MATLYDQLNQAGRIDRIDLHNYLHILIDRLAQAYLTAESPVKIETRLPALELETKQAMPLGLIVNELVTNALKYAFPAGQTGIIRVEVDESGKEITLCVADNGVGLATSSPQGDHSGLGLMLVELLTQQLGGKLVINGENGVTAQVKFKKN
jgi:two-component sensor histidine kinase